MPASPWPMTVLVTIGYNEVTIARAFPGRLSRNPRNMGCRAGTARVALVAAKVARVLPRPQWREATAPPAGPSWSAHHSSARRHHSDPARIRPLTVVVEDAGATRKRPRDVAEFSREIEAMCARLTAMHVTGRRQPRRLAAAWSPLADRSRAIGKPNRAETVRGFVRFTPPATPWARRALPRATAAWASS